MKSFEIRSAFTNYFKKQGHKSIPSSSLLPDNDATLLFTNAGMNQFKDVFLGQDKRDYNRAVTVQRCLRAGGKHNDLENVGYTARHHTFFEMLGNFSFGDYFKEQAIAYAWGFLTQELKLPANKLWITVYADDQQAYNIWHKDIGIAKERIIKIGDNKGTQYASDNFWSMGDTGPCGPCTEIFYDHGADIEGGLPGTPEEDGDRYIEIWNIVFMEFNRSADGKMNPLPSPSVDTGMGLERISAVMQGVTNNYDIDSFKTLAKHVTQIIPGNAINAASVRVICDHIRACTFLLADGVLPANEGRGYVLRRIIRRAIRHGHKLGAVEPFFFRLVAGVVEVMGEAGQTIAVQQQQIEKILLQEEEQFTRTLNKGLQILNNELAELQGKTIPGQLIFTLYDTYGFPVDLTNDIARERGLTLNLEDFEQCMEKQRQRARSAGSFHAEYNDSIDDLAATKFVGYERLIEPTQVLGLLLEGKRVDELKTGQKGVVILSSTPFYAESGGQAGDSGFLRLKQGRFQVEDTQKRAQYFSHYGTLLEGKLSVGDTIEAQVTSKLRQQAASNHSATHLLHAALRQILGDQVQQKGSLVEPSRLRFDFSHNQALTNEQISSLMDIVNEQIRANTEVTTTLCDKQTALEKGALALFNEKYDDQVRVLSMGEDKFSVELCGGTHVSRTGQIGSFAITAETAIASGIRRIEALTGACAETWNRKNQLTLMRIKDKLKADGDSLEERVQSLLEQSKKLERNVARLEREKSLSSAAQLSSQAVKINEIQTLVVQVDGVEVKALRGMIDQLKDKLKEVVIVIATVKDNKVYLAAGVTKSLCKRLCANELIQFMAKELEGKGGGRADFAQGGGVRVDKLTDVLLLAKNWIAQATDS